MSRFLKSFSFLFLLPISFLCLAFVLNKPAQKNEQTQNAHAKIYDDHLKYDWADSVLKTLTLEEKIGQLFMVAAYSNKTEAHKQNIINLVEQHHIGGLIFFQGGPARQAQLTNLYQSKAKVPLLISIDGEWGLAMRLDSTISYPRQMQLGAIQDNELIYQMGQDIAQQCKRVGIHVNLAPVLDVNNNPKNPVIGSRSFGENKENVAQKGLAYIHGMQDAGIMANGKHFPGHGDTDKDSHKTLPAVKASKERIKQLELYPFKKAFDEGLGSVMVAHLNIPALDSSEQIASTLSKKIVTDLLKKELKFNGLIFTDALNMKGVSSYFKPGEVDLKALLSGNDVLLFSEDVPKAIQEIKNALNQKLISEKEINRRCKKILIAKQWAGLDQKSNQTIELNKLYEDLHKTSYNAQRRKLIEASLTLVQNKKDLVPLKRLDTLNIASVALGTSSEDVFQKTLKLYAPCHTVQKQSFSSPTESTKLVESLKEYNPIIVTLHGTNERSYKKYGLQKTHIDFIEQLAKSKQVILNFPANPYGLNQFDKISDIASILVSYNDNDEHQKFSAQAIFGGLPITGELPVSNKFFNSSTGIKIKNQTRLNYANPEDLGINSKQLTYIDSIVEKAIRTKAMPGCQVYVAQKGRVIYNKSFGHHTYDSLIKVQNDDLYDIASITKITSTLMCMMHLQGTGEFSLDDPLSSYIPDIVDTTDYKDLVFRQILTHQAGLKPWIPFYYRTLLRKGKGPNPKYYSNQFDDDHDIRVAENLYISRHYVDTVFRTITKTKINEKKKYRYSDLGFYFGKEIIELITNIPIEDYVQNLFYKRLGLVTTTYLPREKFGLQRIVPTENDKLFRQQLVHGDVHDPGAAMMGGIGGHAGLFSNANDLGKIMQMYMNWGKYGGEFYLKTDVVKEFSTTQFAQNDNRRAIGFDKPTMDGSSGPTCSGISNKSFGHSGFTGTLAWADPDKELVYVFLSNRIHPNANNKKLINTGVRTRIMKVIYNAIEQAEKDQKA